MAKKQAGESECATGGVDELIAATRAARENSKPTKFESFATDIDKALAADVPQLAILRWLAQPPRNVKANPSELWRWLERRRVGHKPRGRKRAVVAPATVETNNSAACTGADGGAQPDAVAAAAQFGAPSAVETTEATPGQANATAEMPSLLGNVPRRHASDRSSVGQAQREAVVDHYMNAGKRSLIDAQRRKKQG
jgi:hypothetical protein